MSKPATRSPKRKPQVVLSALRGEISIAVAAVLCLAVPLGCSASRDAAPSEDVIVVPPSTSVLDVGDARSAAAAGVDGAPVRSSIPAAGPAPAPTTTDADTHPTAPTEAASLAPPSTEATPPAVAEPDIVPAGTATEPTPPAVPEPVSTDPAPTGTEPTAAPGPAPDIVPAGTANGPTPPAVPEPVSTDPAPSGPEPTSTTEPVSGATVTGTDPGVADPASTSPAPAPSPPAVLVLRHEPLSFERALEIAARLAGDIVVPNSCELPPLGDPTLLPNAVREYRSGTHQGVDFMCPERTRAAVAALAGHVVVAVGDYENPSPADLDEVLATARRLQATPPYTLVMLYGNHVIIDHGIIDDVGHVVSIYAHLDALDPAIGIGRPVEAGQLLGWVGNSGTNTAAAGALDWSLHLHWELHVDDHYLGAGLSATETRAVYATLFGASAEQRNDHNT